LPMFRLVEPVANLGASLAWISCRAVAMRLLAFLRDRPKIHFVPLVPRARCRTAQPSSLRLGRTRPLCPFPKVSTYKGGGDVEDAANFECR
jgi:hypothetical protein